MEEIPVREFRRILRNFERELNIQNQSSDCCGVTIPQCHMLMALDIKDNITLNELSETINLDKSTVSRTVETLVNNELIDRTIPKNNRRTIILTLTSKGKSVCKSINSQNDRYYKKALAAIPIQYREAFLKGFEAFTNEMFQINKKIL
jgi:DNA-binding MarR family transcriptional regulator